jgi:hypothetical protein
MAQCTPGLLRNSEFGIWYVIEIVIGLGFIRQVCWAGRSLQECHSYALPIRECDYGSNLVLEGIPFLVVEARFFEKISSRLPKFPSAFDGEWDVPALWMRVDTLVLGHLFDFSKGGSMVRGGEAVFRDVGVCGGVDRTSINIEQ